MVTTPNGSRRRSPSPNRRCGLQESSLSMADEHRADSRRKNGPAASQLLGGDMGAYGNDHSAADLGAASMLAFYTQDPEQISRIIGNSGLYRPKWDRPDYRRRTERGALRPHRDLQPR